MDNTSIVQRLYSRYVSTYGKNLQGCCIPFANDVINLVGGVPVAGELCWYGGSCRRTHWWVEKDGVVIDPIGDFFLEGEVDTSRVEIHRDKEIFYSLLPIYKQYSV